MWALLAAEITDAEISNNNNNDFNDVIFVIFFRVQQSWMSGSEEAISGKELENEFDTL